MTYEVGIVISPMHWLCYKEKILLILFLLEA